MTDDIEWLQSRRGVCKVDLYIPTNQQDQDQKVICFVDVSTLDAEDKDCKDAAGSKTKGELNLENLGEKEIILIKDPEKQNQSKMEGSVCLVKQAPSDSFNVLSRLFSDLQKYALGFQHALSPTAFSCRHKVGAIKDEIPSENCYSTDQQNQYPIGNGPPSLHLEMTAFQNTNNNQIPSNPATKPVHQKKAFAPDGECSKNDLSSYVSQLSSLVVQMADKEIKDKLEGGSKCPPQSMYPAGAKGQNKPPHSCVSMIASEMAQDAVELVSTEMCGTGTNTSGEECPDGRKTFLYRELSNKCGERQTCQRDGKEFAESINKGLVVYANQVASDMMVSVLKTLKVQSCRKPLPACVILKRVLLKHTKEIVSDLIDSCLKNLHGITGVLMTDSDFVCAVKRNLFNHGKQNANNIMQAMLRRLVTALLGERKETKSQSLSYATLKTGIRDPKCNNQRLEFSAMKTEMKGSDKCKEEPDPCKSLAGPEKIGEHILKEGLTMWDQKYGNEGSISSMICTSKDEKRGKINPSTDSLAKDLIVSALKLIQYHLTQQAGCKALCEDDCPGSSMGHMSYSSQYQKSGCGQSSNLLSVKHIETQGNPGPSTCVKENQQLDCQKMDMSNMVLSLIQKLLCDSPFSCDGPSDNEKLCDPCSSKGASMAKRSEELCQENPKPELISGMKQMNHQFVDQLVDSVMKLCLIMAKYGNSGPALAELEQASSCQEGTISQSCQDSPVPEVIVNNQCAMSTLQKQLQAVLQWIAASQFNVPTLYFMGNNEGQLNKLPEVSDKAVEKGCNVGDLLQGVMKFAKELELDKAVGNMAKKQLLDWLLNNL